MGVESSTDQKSDAELSRAPRSGIRLMVVILTGLALVAIYSNIQKVRRGKIERVIVTPISIPTPTAAPSGR